MVGAGGIGPGGGADGGLGGRMGGDQGGARMGHRWIWSNRREDTVATIIP